MIKFNKHLLIALFSSLFLTNLNLGLALGPPGPGAELTYQSCQFEVKQSLFHSWTHGQIGVQDCRLVISSRGGFVSVEHTGVYSESDKELIEDLYQSQIEEGLKIRSSRLNSKANPRNWGAPIRDFKIGDIIDIEMKVRVFSNDGKVVIENGTIFYPYSIQ